MVAEFEAVPMEQVWEIGVIQFLNDLLYLKMKGEHDKAQFDKEARKARY